VEAACSYQRSGQERTREEDRKWGALEMNSPLQEHPRLWTDEAKALTSIKSTHHVICLDRNKLIIRMAMARTVRSGIVHKLGQHKLSITATRIETFEQKCSYKYALTSAYSLFQLLILKKGLDFFGWQAHEFILQTRKMFIYMRLYMKFMRHADGCTGWLPKRRCKEQTTISSLPCK